MNNTSRTTSSTSAAAKAAAAPASAAGRDSTSKPKHQEEAMVVPKLLPLLKVPSSTPTFPKPGSILGGRYFVLKRLGQGTFCSIHECVDLSYLTSTTATGSSSNNTCMVAAKVELSNFVNSGVLVGEASVLKHLNTNMPPNMIPKYYDYLENVPTQISMDNLDESEKQQLKQQMENNGAAQGGEMVGANGAGVGGPGSQQATTASAVDANSSAILMEFLPGEDMARLRDRCCLMQKYNLQAANAAAATATTDRQQHEIVLGFPTGASRTFHDMAARNAWTHPHHLEDEDEEKEDEEPPTPQQQQQQQPSKSEVSSGVPEHITMKKGSSIAVSSTKDAHPNDDLSTTNNKTSGGQGGMITTSTSTGAYQHPTRRVNLKDSVYLCADVLLPLLKEMHDAGIIHRDVKPSNIVRTGTTSEDKWFKLVDFGLSKTFVVPEESSFADKNLPWDGPNINLMTSIGAGASDTGGVTEATSPNKKKSSNNNDDKYKSGRLFHRRERTQAEFRGTSMYASLKVHQLYDYCRRDDLWSLMYVFCDFVAGGLPWMFAASQRDKQLVLDLKDMCHCDNNKNVAAMLYGPSYHSKVTAIDRTIQPKQDTTKTNLSVEEMDELKVQLPNLSGKIDLLRRAFNHLGELKFGDRPDYELIEACLRGFVVGDENEASPEELEFEDVPELDWNSPEDEQVGTSTSTSTNVVPIATSSATTDMMDVDMNNKETKKIQSLADYACGISGSMFDHNPDLLLQLKLAKVAYNATNAAYYNAMAAAASNNHVSQQMLEDWLSACRDLLQMEPKPIWDVTKREKYGDHRYDSDGYRREEFLKEMERCAHEFGFQRLFQEHFMNVNSATKQEEEVPDAPSSGPATSSSDVVQSSNAIESSASTTMNGRKQQPSNKRKRKRRLGCDDVKQQMLSVSRTMLSLLAMREAELMKKIAPPPKITFA